MKNIFVFILLLLTCSCSQKGHDDRVEQTYFKNGTVKTQFVTVNDTLDGYFKEFYPSGSLMVSGHYSKGQKKGEVTIYYENGNVQTIGRYEGGKRACEWSYFHKNNKLSAKGFYENGKKEGKWQEYFSNGNIKYKGKYQAGNSIGTHYKYDSLREGEISSKAEFLLVRGKQHLVHIIKHEGKAKRTYTYKPLKINLEQDSVHVGDSLTVNFKLSTPEFDNIRVTYGGFNKHFTVVDSNKLSHKRKKGHEIDIKVGVSKEGNQYIRGYVADFMYGSFEGDSLEIEKGDTLMITTSRDYYFQIPIDVRIKQ